MERRLLAMARVLATVGLAGSAAFGAGYTEEVVSFATHDGLEIDCILSYPDDGSGPHPGMLLLPGSGLHDADVTLSEPTLDITDGPQSLFRPLARHFSRRGWAVQRCNKRGASFHHTRDRPRILAGSTLRDLVEDARGALAALREHPRVAARPLVVFGHSEGTVIALRLARTNPAIDLVVLAGSLARPFEWLIEYQLVDRNLNFLRQAADTDGDGALTLEELDALDGNFGLGSVYVLNSSEILFRTRPTENGSFQVLGLSAETDLNDDGRLQIASEIEPALRRESGRLRAMAREGALGSYWQSLFEAKATSSFIHRTPAPILFIHGALDIQTPVDEALLLIDTLERRGRRDYDVLIFPDLGHSLSKPNDFYRDDGGLSTLDNLTLNAPERDVRRKILRRIEANLQR